MELLFLIREGRVPILAQSEEILGRFHLTHYEDAGAATLRERLERLFDVTVRCLESRNLTPILTHAQTVARERYHAGFDLFEVQTAFNTLEQVIWREIIEKMEPVDYARALGSLGTVLGAGKDSLARTYVECATETKVTSLDLTHLFQGV